LNKEQELLQILVEEVNKCRYAWFSPRLLDAQKQASKLLEDLKVGVDKDNNGND